MSNDDYEYSPIPEGKRASTLKAQPTKMEMKIDMSEVTQDLPEDFEDLQEDYLERIHQRMRDHLYEKIIEGGTSAKSILDIRSHPDYPMRKKIKDIIHRQGYVGKFYGIGVHEDVITDLKKDCHGAVDRAPDIPEAFGVPIKDDPRRSRDQALFFRSERIWRAYLELLNDNVPDVVKRALYTDV